MENLIHCIQQFKTLHVELNCCYVIVAQLLIPTTSCILALYYFPHNPQKYCLVCRSSNIQFVFLRNNANVEREGLGDLVIYKETMDRHKGRRWYPCKYNATSISHYGTRHTMPFYHVLRATIDGGGRDTKQTPEGIAEVFSILKSNLK